MMMAGSPVAVAAVPDTISSQTVSTIHKAKAYSPMQLNFLKPADILPIVGQVEAGDRKAYEHIEHLGIAEATKIRDMMWEY